MTTPFAAPTGTFSQRSNTADAYYKRIAADPSYRADQDVDKVGWIIQNYGAEWLTPDGKAPQEAVWTYTGGENGAPRIGSTTGISTVPWGTKDYTYDPMSGQDYRYPQYANGPNGMPTGGLQGTPQQVQADRDRTNYFRNGGQGINPQTYAGLELQGLPMQYRTPTGGDGSQGNVAPQQGLRNADGSPYVPAGQQTVPSGPSPYVPLPNARNFSANQQPAAAPGVPQSWMQTMGNQGADAQQMALIAALRGEG